MLKLVVALGNPGRQYVRTRHNIGWLALEQLSFAPQLQWREKFKGLYADYPFHSQKVYFLLPQTYMNLSGESVQPLTQFFKIAPEEMLVVHDEVDVDFGVLGFKQGGGLAGHNGLKSIAQRLGSQDFKRLRLGVSRPSLGDVASWVLSPFSQEEEVGLGQVLERASQAIECCLSQGFDRAASRFSKQSGLL